jgi:hypothetical protein
MGKTSCMKYILAFILLFVTLSPAIPNSSRKPLDGPCCLCECGSTSRAHCSMMCKRFEAGRKTVNEQGIAACTKSCKRKGVPNEEKP